ncbi:MAG: hypothetical protein A2958_02425 [Candidatus Levybacteria bacterium RIFCSPLOWO2_01_FULL_38_13]|nr:MAG: hypothetical protein A2629_04055 [Candidatus Levybacteria bacterium RIFCSPHIGHO2_01_FULL_41_15]OGH35105.1 MAG: hypothetical protein A2958_02425 [Candidatus Levybacteria bacterium RIFCSPLOWO2_01_FULL_38_13]
MASLSIPLSNGFSPKVKKDDKVVVGQVIASRILKGKDQEVNVSRILGLPASQISKVITKRPGDRIEEGEVIALKKGALGVGGKKVVSPVGGTLFGIDEEKGAIFIRSNLEEETQDLSSPVDGKILLCDNEKITIESDKDIVLAKEAAGEAEVQGEVHQIKGEDVDPKTLDLKIKGKIVLGRFFSREALSKSIGLGALGIISENIKEEDLEEYIKRIVKTPVFLIDEKAFEEVSRHSGKKVYLSPLKKLIMFL